MGVWLPAPRGACNRPSQATRGVPTRRGTPLTAGRTEPRKKNSRGFRHTWVRKNRHTDAYMYGQARTRNCHKCWKSVTKPRSEPGVPVRSNGCREITTLWWFDDTRQVV